MKKKNLIIVMLVVTAVLFLVLCLYLTQQSERYELSHDTETILINPGVIDGYTDTIRKGIQRIESNSHELMNISFVYPDEVGYGSSPAAEIFNSSGGGVIPILDFNIEGWKDYAQTGNRPIFSISNNVSGSKSNKAELIIIYPGIFENVCQYINEYKNIPYPQNATLINLLPFPQESSEEKILALTYKSACIKLPDGKNYYYDVLVER